MSTSARTNKGGSLRVSDVRLTEIEVSSSLSFDTCASGGKVTQEEVWAIASELFDARSDIYKLKANMHETIELLEQALAIIAKG